MIEDGRPCDEVVTQLLAVRGADEVVRMVLTDRIAECLTTLAPSDAEKAIGQYEPLTSCCAAAPA